MFVWIDGGLRPIDEARIDPRDRGFTLGDGLYETICVRNGSCLRIDRHFARLRTGLDLLEMPLERNETAWDEAIRQLLAATGTVDGVVRLTVGRGVAARGMAPDPTARTTLVIAAAPFTAPPPARVVIARTTRRNALSPISRIKTTSCLDSIVARLEATRRNADDALLLNGAGTLAEASAANLFAMLDGALVTPPIADGALPGVMRSAIAERLAVTERSLTPEELGRADEIFLSSSLGVRPVIELEGRAYPVGPIAAALRTINDPQPQE